jgi:uncharacterized protein (TIGR02217 family)
MSNAIYPTLPGITFKVIHAPRFKTQIDETASGREYRQALMVYPRVRTVLQYEFLRNRSAADELQQLVGFFKARKGSYDSFLFNNPDDNTATAQQFGTGDGVTTSFQLLRTLGGFAEPVYDLNGVPQIYKAGVLQGAGYSINSAGLVTFTAAPTAGQVLTWSGAYYWRNRFLNDEQEFEKFMQQLWQAGRVEMLSIKP